MKRQILLLLMGIITFPFLSNGQNVLCEDFTDTTQWNTGDTVTHLFNDYNFAVINTIYEIGDSSSYSLPVTIQNANGFSGLYDPVGNPTLFSMGSGVSNVTFNQYGYYNQSNQMGFKINGGSTYYISDLIPGFPGTYPNNPTSGALVINGIQVTVQWLDNWQGRFILFFEDIDSLDGDTSIHDITIIFFESGIDNICINDTSNETINFQVAINSICSNELNDLIGEVECNATIKDVNGNTVAQHTIISTNSYSTQFQYNPLLAPYTFNLDQSCYESNDVFLNEYTYTINPEHIYGNHGVDTIYLCENNDLVNFHVAIYSVCNNEFNNNLDQLGCFATIKDVNGNVLAQNMIVSGNGSGPYFQYNPLLAPYTLNLDQNCFEANGLFLNEYIYTINAEHIYGNNGVDSIFICPSTDTTSSIVNFHVAIYSACNNEFNNNLDQLGCFATIKDVNGNVLAQNMIVSGNGSGPYFQYNPLLAPYTLNLDQNCFEANGLFLNEYTYLISDEHIYGNFGIDSIFICSNYDSTLISCVDLYSSVTPWIGYFQNYQNTINFNWGNNSSSSQNATITIDLPPGVTVVPSSLDYPYVVSGSQLTLTITLAPNSSIQDRIKVNVPGGINDGLLHCYNIEIRPSNTEDCNLDNNEHKLCMIVGNSYDPNDKTVNQQERISADAQDEFTYTIRFQNTGTAPAQDIYIIDTLSTNLDWSTFSLLRSSHNVTITDLGNGIKRFNYNGIWLPDSSTNLVESQGYLTYKIKEKANNSVGTEIFNTAYIYFDHNPAIITNTTYNINVLPSELGIEDLKNEMNVTLFPNPATDFVELKADNHIEKIEIYSADGKLCLTTYPNSKATQLNVIDFTSGVYLVKLNSIDSSNTIRLIKK